MKTLTTEEEQVSYSLGMNIGSSLRNQGFDKLNVEAIAAAIADVFANRPLQIDPNKGEELLDNYFQKLQSQKHSKNIEQGQQFLTENGTKEGVVSLASGLQYKVMKAGTGSIPKATDTVTTHYHGTLIDGTIFDSSVRRGEPASFPVNGVIAGWVEALQLMPVGSKWQLFVPANLAYGTRGAGELIGPHTTLIFEVELLSIN